jgi:hypothetical protein
MHKGESRPYQFVKVLDHVNGEAFSRNPGVIGSFDPSGYNTELDLYTKEHSRRGDLGT